MSELYTLPDGWEWKTFDDELILIQNGLSDTQNDDKIGYPISRIETIQNETLDSNRIKYIDVDNYSIIEKYKYDYGDLLFSHINSFEKVGKTCLYTNQIDNLLHGVNLLRMKFTRNVISKFVFYYLISNVSRRFYEPHIKKAINQASINQKNIKSIPLPLPPLEEQKRIVAKLDNLFAKIDKAIALHQKNIDEANVFMASVLNDVFVELEEKYEKKQLNEIVIFGGKNISTLEYPNLIYFSLEDVEAQTGRILNCKTVNEAGVKGTAVKFDENVVLYSKLRPYLNKVIVPNLEGCSTTELVVLKPKDKLDKYFLASYLRSSNIVNFLNNDSMGAKMPRTNMKTFRNLEISFPPYETQQKVVSYLDEISSKMEKIKQIQKEKMQSLKALKASILDQAFKGEL